MEVGKSSELWMTPFLNRTHEDKWSGSSDRHMKTATYIIAVVTNCNALGFLIPRQPWRRK
jgi:hypothetical protein